MKIARLAGPLLVGILAASSLAAPVAFAAPEFKPTGATLTGTSGSGTLEAAGEKVTCEKDTSTGVVSSATLVGNIVVHFLNCSGETALGEKCTVKSTNQSTKGLILTNTLHGVLGLILPKPATGSDVALLLLPASGKVWYTIAGESKCVETTKATGSLAGVVEPVGKSQTTGKVVFAETGGKQNVGEVDLSTGGVVKPEFVMFGATVTVATTESLTYSAATEVT